MTASDKLDMLLLVRLLTCRTAPTLAQLARDTSPFYRDPPGTAALEEAVERLRAAGLVSPRARQLTEEGRQRALSFLQLDKLPARWTWKTVKDKALVPMALGLDRAEAERLLKSPGRLTALLLRNKLGLPERAGQTVPAVLEALTCRELGHPEITSLQELMAAVLSRHIGADPPLGPDEVQTQVPRVLLGGRGKDLRPLALLGWGDAETSAARPAAPSPGAEMDLATFAAIVHEQARTCPTGRFGDDKVFVGHLWSRLEAEPAFGALGLQGFKARLLEANRAGLLRLGRADLVQKMDPAEVQRSETAAQGAVYHFVVAGPTSQGRTA